MANKQLYSLLMNLILMALILSVSIAVIGTNFKREEEPWEFVPVPQSSQTLTP